MTIKCIHDLTERNNQRLLKDSGKHNRDFQKSVTQKYNVTISLSKLSSLSMMVIANMK